MVDSKIMMTISCPICNSVNIIFQKYLNSSLLTNELRKYFGDKSISKNSVGNYGWYKCMTCDLEFANPLVPGNKKFYDYVTSHDQYYCEERWEWSIVLNQIKNKKSVCDVGCGDGRFLSRCKKVMNNKIKCFGIDSTKSSIDKCKAKNLSVFYGTTADYINNKHKKFDVVTCFHCLEHVDNPRQFLIDLKSLLNKNGVLFISTPYNSYPREKWFEVMNYPPHHLTAWRERTYKKIASLLKAKVKLYMPEPTPFVGRLINSINLYWYGPNVNKILSIQSIYKLFSNPSPVIKIFFNQVFREKTISYRKNTTSYIKNKKTASSVVLAELRKFL